MEKEIYIINEKNGQEAISEENIYDVSKLNINSLLLHSLGFDEKNQCLQMHSKETYIISIISQFNRIKSKLANNEQSFLIAASLGECGNAFLNKNIIKALYELYAVNNNNLASAQSLCTFYGCYSSLNKISNNSDFINLIKNQVDHKNLKINFTFASSSSSENKVKEIAENFLINFFDKEIDNE